MAKVVGNREAAEMGWVQGWVTERASATAKEMEKVAELAAESEGLASLREVSAEACENFCVPPQIPHQELRCR